MTPSEIANKLTEGKTQLLATDRELIAEFDALIKILNNLPADETISDSISKQINALIQKAVASLGPNRAMQSAAPVRNVRSETGL